MYQGITMHTGLMKAGDMAIQAPGKGPGKSGLKVSGAKDAEDANSRDTVLNISKEAKQKYAAHAVSAKSVKKVGVASTRELFENKAAKLKRSARGRCGSLGPDLQEMIRLDDPEAYEKQKEFMIQSSRADYEHMPEKAKEYALKAVDVRMEWYYRRCYDKDFWSLAGFTALDALDSLYSDEVHDTSFNFYGKNASDPNASLWRYDSKFNVLLTVDMLKDMASLAAMDEKARETAKTREDYQAGMEKVDRAISEMKKAELDYEGDLEYLRFGVKLWEDGNVTYHANYKGCENEDGIMAGSAQELLEKLMAA